MGNRDSSTKYSATPKESESFLQRPEIYSLYEKINDYFRRAGERPLDHNEMVLIGEIYLSHGKAMLPEILSKYPEIEPRYYNNDTLSYIWKKFRKAISNNDQEEEHVIKANICFNIDRYIIGKKKPIIGSLSKEINFNSSIFKNKFSLFILKHNKLKLEYILGLGVTEKNSNINDFMDTLSWIDDLNWIDELLAIANEICNKWL
jgi:hypothetical protein